MDVGEGNHSVVLSAMADGIGSLTFATEEWVAVAAERLGALVDQHAPGLADLGAFTLCEVAHNAPAHVHAGASLAWHMRLDGATTTVAAGELPAGECDLKIEGDHSIMSNVGEFGCKAATPQWWWRRSAGWPSCPVGRCKGRSLGIRRWVWCCARCTTRWRP